MRSSYWVFGLQIPGRPYPKDKNIRPSFPAFTPVSGDWPLPCTGWCKGRGLVVCYRSATVAGSHGLPQMAALCPGTLRDFHGFKRSFRELRHLFRNDKADVAYRKDIIKSEYLMMISYVHKPE
jgi:hypothetical protein